jgi:hypothetical protein
MINVELLKLSLIQNERSQYVVINADVIITWNDVSLTWEPADYGYLNTTPMLATDIWTPDIILLNRYIKWRI